PRTKISVPWLATTGNSVEGAEFSVELIAQFPLEHLADGAARQLVGEDQPIQALGLAHLVVEPLQDLLRRGVCSRLEYPIADRRLAPAGGGYADDSDFLQVRMLPQYGFQIAG